MQKWLMAIGMLLCMLSVSAQKKVWVGKANKIFNIQAQYQYIRPGGDFAARFNSINSVGGGVSIKTTHNVFYGIEGNYHFSNDMKPSSTLNNLVSGGGYIASSSGYPSQLSLGMRGFAFLAKGGYIIPVSSRNRNSGIYLTFGAGLVMHKYNINITQENVPSLTEAKRAGYDRYSSGWALNEFVGYWHQSKSRYINFYAGFEFMQAATYNRRGFNYDNMQYDKDLHHDYYYGIKFGWIIPRYLKTKNSDDEFIFE